jgi:hypothetical protein
VLCIFSESAPSSTRKEYTMILFNIVKIAEHIVCERRKSSALVCSQSFIEENNYVVLGQFRTCRFAAFRSENSATD